MIRILATGTTGQLVTSLVESAPAAGMEVITAGRPALDLAAPAAIGELVRCIRPDIVVNAAAYTAVDKAESESDLAFEINASGAEAVAAAAAAANVPIIHVSTDYVFDGTKNAAYVESDPVAPASVYGRSKREGERRVAAAAPRHIILRTSWVHSPFGTNFVKTMLRLAQSRPELAVVDDQSGCPTYAPHLAAGILRIARNVTALSGGSPSWGVYHAAGSGETTWCGLAREAIDVSRRMGGPHALVKAITTADYPTAAVRPRNSRLDCTKLEAAFGITLPDWRRGVEECVNRIMADALSAERTSRKDRSV